MMAVDFAVRFTNSLFLPLSINISYGSNDGSHTGNRLLELFMEQVSFYGKNIISVATGNEGRTRRHASLNLSLIHIFPFQLIFLTISFNSLPVKGTLLHFFFSVPFTTELHFTFGYYSHTFKFVLQKMCIRDRATTLEIHLSTPAIILYCSLL